MNNIKKSVIILVGIAIAAIVTSCGVGYASLQNQNQNSTQVHLSNNNFKVLGKVSGYEEVSYVLIFGGKNKKQMYAEAYSKMLEKAELESGPRALVNVLTEEHIGGGFPPLFYARTVTVSAHVIEFTQ